MNWKDRRGDATLTYFFKVVYVLCIRHDQTVNELIRQWNVFLIEEARNGLLVPNKHLWGSVECLSFRLTLLISNGLQRDEACYWRFIREYIHVMLQCWVPYIHIFIIWEDNHIQRRRRITSELRTAPIVAALCDTSSPVLWSLTSYIVA